MCWDIFSKTILRCVDLVDGEIKLHGRVLGRHKAPYGKVKSGKCGISRKKTPEDKLHWKPLIIQLKLVFHKLSIQQVHDINNYVNVWCQGHHHPNTDS